MYFRTSDLDYKRQFLFRRCFRCVPVGCAPRLTLIASKVYWVQQQQQQRHLTTHQIATSSLQTQSRKVT